MRTLESTGEDGSRGGRVRQHRRRTGGPPGRGGARGRGAGPAGAGRPHRRASRRHRHPGVGAGTAGGLRRRHGTRHPGAARLRG